MFVTEKLVNASGRRANGHRTNPFCWKPTGAGGLRPHVEVRSARTPSPCPAATPSLDRDTHVRKERTRSSDSFAVKGTRRAEAARLLLGRQVARNPVNGRQTRAGSGEGFGGKKGH